jgi:murein DD-endopeptidase MepM/ murein hydrolase activator NlpD
MARRFALVAAARFCEPVLMSELQTPLRLATALSLSLLLCACGSEPDDAEYVWPIGGTEEIQPISSSFGPRLQSSRGSKYDFHRGIDIPAFMGTPIYSIAGGTVTRSGRDPAYADLVVQVQHCKEGRECIYSNYLHLSLPLVEVGDVVERGQQIAYSGIAADSGFAHLHFEIREGRAEQDHCVHPLRFLPVPSWMPPSVSFTTIDDATPTAVSVEVEVALPATAAGLVQVAVKTSRRSTGETLEERVFDCDEWNRKYTNGDSGAIDDPIHAGIHVEPEPFNEESPVYAMSFRLKDLKGAAERDDLEITARARDVNGHETVATAP